MISSKRIYLALAALVLVVLGAGSASAQTTPVFDVSTAVPFVANTGRSEVLGQVTLTANVNCQVVADNFCVSVAGTIQVLYVGTPIDNAIATANVGLQNTNGIEVCEVIGGVTTCNAAGTYITPAFTATNSTAGGVVSFGVLGGVDFAAGDQVVIRGVRGQVDLGPGNVVGTAIFAQLTTSPSTIAGFNPVSQEVARSADPLTMAFGAWTILQCLPAANFGTVTVTEGFNTAFVDQDNAGVVVDPADTQGATANPRPLFSPRPAARVARNSRINIVLTGKPSGITITWPTASAVDNGTGATGAQLLKIAQSVSGDQVSYVYVTPNQAVSDINGERFVITVLASAVALSGTSNDFGTTLGQGQMFDPANTQSQPRYNHPLEPVPPATWLTVAPCTTNLLYPWVLNFAGFDTGIAIANTSTDPYGTIGQNGTCTVNLYPTDTTTSSGVSAGASVNITTSTVATGSVWRATMSGVPAFAGKAGYIIAVCRFQYGHGFAFFTDNFGVGAAATAQGYVANIIPDPVLLGGTAGCGNILNPAGNFRSAAGYADDTLGFCAPPYGEGLGN